MVSERQRIEASPNPVMENSMPPPPSYEEANGMFSSPAVDGSAENVEYFLAEVINSFSIIEVVGLPVSCHSFLFNLCSILSLSLQVIHSYHAETDVELNLSVGDYIVVRKVIIPYL